MGTWGAPVQPAGVCIPPGVVQLAVAVPVAPFAQASAAVHAVAFDADAHVLALSA